MQKLLTGDKVGQSVRMERALEVTHKKVKGRGKGRLRNKRGERPEGTGQGRQWAQGWGGGRKGNGRRWEELWSARHAEQGWVMSKR